MSSVQVLRDEYLKRREKNEHYSMRAFARDLGVSHTYLSLVFSGKRTLSTSQTAQIGMLLGLSGTELQQWIEKSLASHPQKRGVNAKLSKQISASEAERRQMVDLQLEYEKVLGGWYYLALLDSTFLKGATADPRWFAEKLGLNAVEVRDAIDRLKTLEMIEEKNERFQKTENFVHVNMKKPTTAMRAYHRGVIGKALEAMNDASTDAFERRMITAGSVAIKKVKIKAARERVKQFVSEFITEFGAKDADELYQINLQLFPLTQAAKKKTQKRGNV